MDLKSSLAVFALLILVTGTVYAQNQQGKAGRPVPASSGVRNSNIHSVNTRLRQQMRQVRQDLRDGKLTKEQVQASWEKFKSIRRQELEFFRQNGRKDITDNQRAQLNASLDQASK